MWVAFALQMACEILSRYQVKVVPLNTHQGCATPRACKGSETVLQTSMKGFKKRAAQLQIKLRTRTELVGFFPLTLLLNLNQKYSQVDK